MPAIRTNNQPDRKTLVSPDHTRIARRRGFTPSITRAIRAHTLYHFYHVKNKKISLLEVAEAYASNSCGSSSCHCHSIRFVMREEVRTYGTMCLTHVACCSSIHHVHDLMIQNYESNQLYQYHLVHTRMPCDDHDA